MSTYVVYFHDFFSMFPITATTHFYDVRVIRLFNLIVSSAKLDPRYVATLYLLPVGRRFQSLINCPWWRRHQPHSLPVAAEVFNSYGPLWQRFQPHVFALHVGGIGLESGQSRRH